MRTLLLLPLLLLVPSTPAAAPAADEVPGWLGLLLANGKENAGVLVRGVVEGSPADEARVRAKDSIVAVDGTAVGTPEELMARVRGLDPGSFVTLSVKRGQHDLELRTVLGTRPESTRLVRGWLGVSAIELPASLRAHFGAPENAGILVSDVTEASPAYDSGIRVGDVIYEADGQPVTSAAVLSRLVSQAGVENVIDVVLSRDGARIVVGPRIDRAPAPRAEP
jgi:serine protease Do